MLTKKQAFNTFKCPICGKFNCFGQPCNECPFDGEMPGCPDLCNCSEYDICNYFQKELARLQLENNELEYEVIRLTEHNHYLRRTVLGE